MAPMHDPFTVEGEWLRCALTRTRRAPTASSSPRHLRLTTARGLRRARDHRPLEANRGGVERAPARASERRAELHPPGARDGHVLGYGLSADADLARSAPSTQTSSARRISSTARRRRLPRPSLLDRRDPGLDRAARERRRDRGLERGLRARGRARASRVHWDELLENGRLCFGLRPTTPITRASTPTRVDVGAGAERSRGGAGALAADVLRQHRAACLYDVEPTGTRSRSLQPGLLGHARSGRTRGAAVDAGRLGYRYAGTVLADEDGGIVARAARRAWRGANARIEVTDARGNRAWTNPLEELDAPSGSRAAVRPARRRRRDRRCRDRERGRAGLAVALVDRGDFGARPRALRRS